MKKRFCYLLILLTVLFSVRALSQPVEQYIKVVVAPDHADWTYKTGETAKFEISVLQNGNPIKDVKVKYQVGLEKLEPTMKKEGVVLSKGKLSVEGGTLKNPGFLRCIVEADVDGKLYKGMATAGFDPLSIKPTVPTPVDFIEFWDKAKSDLATIPIDAKMTLLPERCTEKVNVYHVNIQNFRVGSRLYGILCV